MSEFWCHMAPWLIMAVSLPVAIVLALKIYPSDEWAETVIRAWADSNDLRISAIDEARWYDRLLLSQHVKTYRVRVADRKGRERECKAVVGRFLLFKTSRNISITWIKPRGSDG